MIDFVLSPVWQEQGPKDLVEKAKKVWPDIEKAKADIISGALKAAVQHATLSRRTAAPRPWMRDNACFEARPKAAEHLSMRSLGVRHRGMKIRRERNPPHAEVPPFAGLEARTDTPCDRRYGA